MQQKGGDKPNNVDSELVNRFTDPRMEKYMNPIYGLVYCEIGYVPNVFYLRESKIKIDFIPENHLDIIGKMIKEGSTIRPSRDIMNETVTLTEIGEYIAIKYVNMIAENEDAQIVKKNASGYVPGKLYLNNKNYNKNKELQQEWSEVVKSIKKFNRYIPFVDNDIFVFYMLLFCLWWKLGNNNGFDKYYEGIQKVFNIVNQCFPEQNFVLKEKPVSNISPLSFEQIVLESTRSEFQLYQQEQSLHFCKTATQSYYADCGETTVRNIINILCYDGKKFNLEYLSEKGAIEQLKKYYEYFNTFELQSTANARNAWSKLIIEHAQNDINFSIYCETEKRYGYDMDSGLAKNGEKPNLLQMLQNLLQNVDTWDKLINTNIKEVESKLNVNGIGDIYIINSSGQKFTVHLQDGHFYVSLPQKSKNKLKNYGHLESHQKYFLDILYKTYKRKEDILNNENKENIEKEYLKYYLNLSFSSEKLVELFNNVETTLFLTLHLKTLLFQLTLTEKYDSDTRRRMDIYYNKDDPFFDKFCDIVNSNELIVNKVNEYSFIPSNSKNGFEFVSRLPALKVINTNNSIASRIEEIDLSPLTQIEHIGEKFLSRFTDLIKIDLSPLSNVKTIGNDFLRSCVRLEKIDLTPLINITSISSYFLANCQQLNEVKFPKNFENLKNIGNQFLLESTALKTIDLSYFSNVEKIGNSFLNESGIETIDLSPLKNLVGIDSRFMSECDNLTSITFPETFENVKEIGDAFLARTNALKTIDLSCFSNVTKINNFFLYESGIETIDLSPLKKLTTIEENFMEASDIKSITFPESFNYLIHIGSDFLSNTYLKTIDLSPLKNLVDIDNNFMLGCNNLTSITFPETFENVKEIGINFLAYSKALKTIDLSCFSNVKKINKYFLYESGIETIDLSPLKKINTLNRRFIENCYNLKSVIMPSILKGKLYFEDHIEKIYTNNSRVFTKLDAIGRGKKPTKKIKRNLKRKTKRNRRSLRA